MDEPTRHSRLAAAAIDLWRLFYLIFPLFLVGTGAVATIAISGASAVVERGRPYLVREWKVDADFEKRIADEGRATWSALGTLVSEVAGEARGAAWDSAAAQKLRERFVDEAKKEPALERLVDQLAKSYEALVLFAERSESKADFAAVKSAVGERIGASAKKIDGAKARVVGFARTVALYRASQLAEYAGLASLAGTLRGMVDAKEPAAKPEGEPGAGAGGRDPLKYLSFVDKVFSGRIGVKRELAAAIRLEIVVVVVLALLGFVLWGLRDVLPGWLFSGRRELGLCVVDAATGESASRRAVLTRGVVAAILFPLHGLMVAANTRGVADRVAGTRVVARWSSSSADSSRN